MGLLDWWASRRAPAVEQPMLAHIARITDEQQLLALSQDRSGWWREAAMRRAIELRIDRLMPLLAARLNDHVYAIAERARAQMLVHAAAAPAAQLIAVLPQVLRLRAAGRHDHSGWLQQFETILCERMGLQSLKACVMTPPGTVARACFDVLQRQGAVDEEMIEQLLASSGDLVVLRAALLHVPAPSEEAHARRWQAAAHSKLGAIRVLGAARLLARDPAPADRAFSAGDARDAYAVAALLDTQAAVRASATAYLVQRRFDVVGHYRAVLTDRSAPGKHQVAALAGLEALRASSELPLIRRMDFASPRVRRAACRAWIKLADAEKDAAALAALRDCAPGVRRFAYTAVSRHGAYVPDEVVAATLRPGVDAELYRAFAERDRWEWLIYLADTAAHTPSHDPACKRLRDDLRRWTYDPNPYTRPTPRQALRLAEAKLHEHLERLAAGDEYWTRELRNALAGLS